MLKPGGYFSAYDWMKNDGEYSEDMQYWFEMEGLSYSMETPKRQQSDSTRSGIR